MAQIFLVEDDERVASFIQKALAENNYAVDLARDGAEAVKMFPAKPYDLIILDLMLPNLSGIEVCRHIRQKDKQIAILMLTAQSNIDDKVNGLNAGADDYLVKPFHYRELQARIEALLRRKSIEPDSHIVVADITLDTHSGTAERSGQRINLTTKEFALLELLMRNPNKILSRQTIAEKVWGIDFDTGTNVVDVYVNYLRNKIEKGFDAKYIHTVIGKGYIFKTE
ncbi:MAG: response regulator transcription factor [Mucilaginibacter sp.]|uniref:response regulator transcription factor n=1 Tax=Mucilaginibacter sp. L3T2-6 TaxID=3062491 RepID=UPI00267723F2|nr:response regulator transcription factor [Mucilaginibacter sp. L3T2-6]MDO3641872.1 response regulator transcription factor [Mucilaginibacter sp. L3T2-6]MDV6214450.1 response regulator transcription factor [Mucilaginibacter sp. L3T2-6]